MARAAQRLALTQPAVSKAMAEMEATLGVPLLERDARGVRATPFGTALAARARAMLDELGQASRDLAHLADPGAGEVRIGTTEPMTPTIAAAIRRLAASHPRITYDIAVSDTGSLMADLRARRLDLVVTRTGIAEVAPDIAADFLFRVPMVVVADRRNPLLRRRGLTLAALREEPWALSPPGTFLGQIVTAAFQAEGLALPRAHVTSVSIVMRLSLIAGGRHLAMLPRTVLSHPMNSAWLRALPVTVADSSGAIAALTLRGRFMPGPVRLLREAVRAVGPLTPGVDPVGM